jgi:hypothetical protein
VLLNTSLKLCDNNIRNNSTKLVDSPDRNRVIFGKLELAEETWFEEYRGCLTDMIGTKETH